MDNKDEIKSLIQGVLPEDIYYNDCEEFANDYFQLKSKLTNNDSPGEGVEICETPKRKVWKNGGKFVNLPKKARKSVPCCK